MPLEIERTARPSERWAQHGAAFARSRQAESDAAETRDNAAVPRATPERAAASQAIASHRYFPAATFLAQQIAQETAPESAGSGRQQARAAIAAYRTAAGDDSTLLGPVRAFAQIRL